MASTPSEADTRERLLRTVKKEVKQIMEEAVTRKFVHEESSSITSLCGAVELCLQHGLKKRALGLFKNSTTNALLQKLSKNFEPATQVVKLLQECENNNDLKTARYIRAFSRSESKNSCTEDRFQKRPLPAYNPKYMWLRLALFEKQLGKIIDYLVNNNSKFYEKEALIADPVDGPILASLLVGPCALDYTKMKTSDHFWTDPPADELVQRHRIHSSAPSSGITRPDSPKRPGLQVRRNTSSSSEDSMRSAPMSAKDYVESLHQNSRSTLLYGKNNVMVQPKEDIERLAGYLSLHQGVEGLTIKWTPNQLMNGCCEQKEEDVDRSLYWDYAVTIYLDEIVYLHCHQQPDSGGTIVLVGQDGVQRPPIHFPRGGHLLAFLSCMENGLLPHGQLDPPLWSQRGKDTGSFVGKVFPKLRRKGSRLTSSMSQTSEDLGEAPGGAVSVLGDEDEATDYVFRIITTFKPDTIPETMMDPKVQPEKAGILAAFPWPQREASSRSILTHPPPTPQSTPPVAASDVTNITILENNSNSIQNYAKTQEQNNITCLFNSHQIGHRSAVKQLCDTMTKQIISRAFYGWLAHCRHLKTVRTHLSGLVNHAIVPLSETGTASNGLTEDIWKGLFDEGVIKNDKEVYRLVYYGGCDHPIRKEVWPYLLGHYKFGSTPEDREKLDERLRDSYEKTMSEWLAVEAIVRQRDKEIMAANLAKLSNESQDGGHITLIRKDSSLSNDVFESVDSDDMSHPETLPEESSSATTPTTPSTILSNRSTETVVVRPPTMSTTSKDTTSTASPDEGLGDSIARQCSLSESKRSDSCDTDKNVDVHLPSESDTTVIHRSEVKGIIITNPSVDSGNEVDAGNGKSDSGKLGSMSEEGEHLSASRESLISPASPISVASNGGVYSAELLDSMALNLHRIDKDVQRCDRAYWYFTPANLDKLRNVMCTYVWEHLEVGYVQGMCDLVAPLLVIFDDEAKSYSCFCQLMKRMTSNFPHGGAMDTHFANMRSLIQILDSELFEHMHQNGDYTHFYFCYRWFLLDFKRELLYDDVFAVWETIWAAKHVSSSHFVLFIALALVEYYREIILDNAMDFTDIIKFFNEMAERHNAKQILKISRELVYRLQDLIENK